MCDVNQSWVLILFLLTTKTNKGRSEKREPEDWGGASGRPPHTSVSLHLGSDERPAPASRQLMRRRTQDTLVAVAPSSQPALSGDPARGVAHRCPAWPASVPCRLLHSSVVFFRLSPMFSLSARWLFPPSLPRPGCSSETGAMGRGWRRQWRQQWGEWRKPG